MGKKARLAVLKKTPESHGIGAPLGNSNGLKHGAFSRLTNLDERSRPVKRIKAIESWLVNHLGGDPTAAEWILIDRVKYKVLRCELFEEAHLSGDNKETDSYYLSWAESIRRDLQALGLVRRQKDINDLVRAMALEAGRHEQ